MILDYVRTATVRKPTWTSASRIPRIERSVPAAVVPERKLEQIRRLAHYPNDGYLPLTYPFIHCLSLHLQNMLDEHFPLPIIGTVHVRSHVLQVRPIGSGESIRAVCYIEGHRQVEAGIEFDLKTHLYSGSSLVWDGTATMLRKVPCEHRLPDHAERLPLDGIGARSQVWRIDKDVARDHAFATGDLNPIHISTLTARVFGYGGPIAHGSWTELRLAATQPALCQTPMVTMSCQFKKPIVLPSTVVFRQWPRRNGAVELRLLDRSAQKPHALGHIGPVEALS